MFNKKPMSSTALSLGKSEYGNQYGGAGYKSVFDISKVGDGKLEKYKIREGENRIDFIPFNAGPQHPFVRTGQCKEGDTVYSLDYYVHKSIGQAKQDFVCLKQFGKRCPLCDESQRLYNLGTEDSKKQATAVRSKRRCVYLVHDLKDGKYYYLDQAWFAFEKHINARAEITIDPTTNAPVSVFDWQVGKTVVFYASKDKWQGSEYNKINESTFTLVDRAPLSDDVLSHSIDLSPGLEEPNEFEMDKVLSGQPVVSEEVPQQPVQAQNPIPPVQETYVPPVPQPTVPPVQQNFNTMAPVQPAPTAGNPVPPTSVENLAEQALQTTAQPASGHVCPFGYAWGDANNQPEHKECATCQVWDKCIDG